MIPKCETCGTQCRIRMTFESLLSNQSQTYFHSGLLRIASDCFRLLWIAADFCGFLQIASHEISFLLKNANSAGRRFLEGKLWHIPNTWLLYVFCERSGCYMSSAKHSQQPGNSKKLFGRVTKTREEYEKYQVSTDYVICFIKLKKKVKCHCPWSDKKADSAFAATQIFYFLSVVFISQWWAPHMFIWQSWQQCKLTIKMTLIFISKEHQEDYISNILMDHSHSVEPEASCLKTQCWPVFISQCPRQCPHSSS